MAEVLRQRGHVVHLAPLLRVKRVHHDRSALERASAVIVTSANAVPALVGLDSDVQLFAVGPDTAAALSEAGFKNVNAAVGTAESLLDLMHKNWKPGDGSLVYASGRHVSVNMAAGLAERGYRCEQVEVYRTSKIRSLPDSARLRLLRGELDAVLFMSVRTAEAFREIVADAGLSESCRWTASVSLSGKIDAQLRHLPWKDSQISGSPTRAGLLEAVAALDRRHRTRVF